MSVSSRVAVSIRRLGSHTERVGKSAALRCFSDSRSGNEKANHAPWHELTPRGLAALNTAGNLCALAAAGTHDHALVRVLSGAAASCVASFNFCMQKPLKTHQKTAGCWGMAFAILHFANLALLLHEQNHGLHLTNEEEDIYEHGFQSHGVTPRQFAKLLKAGAKFQNYAPGERIVAAGDAVQRVLYVTEGTCVAERAAGVVNIEYHQDVFIGTLWPKAWRSEFLGIPFTNEPNTNEDWEDSWLIEQAEARGLRNRGTSDDLHALLRSGLEEKTGPLTNVRAGSAWVSDVVAGPEGCRLLEWPLGVFSCAVGADESLCTAFQHVETMGLASKIVKGASRKALEGYKEILRATLSDNMIRPEEKMALDRYRARHGIPDGEHLQMLEGFGWSAEEFRCGMKTGFWSSLRQKWMATHKS